MFFSTTTIALAATLLLSSNASPIAEPAIAQPAFSPSPYVNSLDARGPNEMLYFVNCQGGGSTQSQMNYYANGKTGSQHGEQPDAVATVSSGSFITWEGRSITGAFPGPNGGTATSNINSNGHSVPLYSFAGTARNSFGQNFNCFRDDEHVLHVGQANAAFQCKSVYYCVDA